MRARYLGDHDNFASWGIQFPRGVFVEVDDPHAQKKIAGNNHFEVENSDAEEVEFIETPKIDFSHEGAASDEPMIPTGGYSTPTPPQSYPGARRGPKPKNR